MGQLGLGQGTTHPRGGQVGAAEGPGRRHVPRQLRARPALRRRGARHGPGQPAARIQGTARALAVLLIYKHQFKI